MVGADSLLASTTYPLFFRASIVRSIEHAFERVKGITSNLPTDLQELALHTLTYALKLDEAWPFASGLLLLMAPKMEQAGFRDQWMSYLQRGIKQSQKLGDAKTEVELRLHLAVLLQYQAQYDAAREHYLFAMSYFESMAERERYAQVVNCLANVAYYQNLFEEARELAHAALKLSENDKQEQASSYRVLGMVALRMREWQSSLHFFEQSLALSQQTNNLRQVAWGFSNRGSILRSLERYGEAIESYQKAIKILKKIEDPVHEAVALMNLGNVYMTLEYSTTALGLYRQAEAIFRKIGDIPRLAALHNNKGMVYSQLEQWGKAKNVYLMSIEQWQRIGHTDRAVNAMDNLGLLYQHQGLYKEAQLTFQEAYNLLGDLEQNQAVGHLLATVKQHLQEGYEEEAVAIEHN